MRIAVISPFVDRQHGTERAVAELVEYLAADHKDEIELYAQRVSDINLKTESAAGRNGIRRINWHRVGSLAGPHLMQFLGWLFLNRFTRWRQERTTRKRPDVVFSPGINAIDADVILVHAVFHRIAHEISRLKIAHTIPVRVLHLFKMVDGKDLRLGFH